MSARQLRAPSINVDDLTITAPLVRRAARAAPAELAERLEEEWLADLITRRNGLARLGLALGCHWASKVIARDFLTAGAVAVASSNESVVLLTPGVPGSISLYRRLMIFILILVMHLALIDAMARGFAMTHAIQKSPLIRNGLTDISQPLVIPVSVVGATHVVPSIAIPNGSLNQ